LASKERDAANGFVYGPYLERVPVNPFSDTSVATDVVDWATAVTTGGWEYNHATGEIRANDSAAHQAL